MTARCTEFPTVLLFNEHLTAPVLRTALRLLYLLPEGGDTLEAPLGDLLAAARTSRSAFYSHLSCLRRESLLIWEPAGRGVLRIFFNPDVLPPVHDPPADDQPACQPLEAAPLNGGPALEGKPACGFSTGGHSPPLVLLPGLDGEYTIRPGRQDRIPVQEPGFREPARSASPPTGVLGGTQTDSRVPVEGQGILIPGFQDSEKLTPSLKYTLNRLNIVCVLKRGILNFKILESLTAGGKPYDSRGSAGDGVVQNPGIRLRDSGEQTASLNTHILINILEELKERGLQHSGVSESGAAALPAGGMLPSILPTANHLPRPPPITCTPSKYLAHSRAVPASFSQNVCNSIFTPGIELFLIVLFSRNNSVSQIMECSNWFSIVIVSQDDTCISNF